MKSTFLLSYKDIFLDCVETVDITPTSASCLNFSLMRQVMNYLRYSMSDVKLSAVSVIGNPQETA